MRAPAALPARLRPIVEATSPERYRVQFTIGKESHDKLRRVQALLRREIPDGDPGAIFDRAIALLLERVEREKLGAATKPRAPRAIRPGTDSQVSSGRLTSRHTPSHVKRSAWQHDGGQCAFVSKDGRRCTERRLPGVPSRPALRAGRADLHREHLAALPAPHSIRGGGRLWSSHERHRG
jgi:hypothetical protein